MSKKNCSHSKCSFSLTGHCFLNNDPVDSCQELKTTEVGAKMQKKANSEKMRVMNWTGEFIRPEDISFISQSASPSIVGIVGTAKAAKTSYLGMVYTLMVNGRFLNDFQFSHTYTINAWEKLSFGLQFHHGKVYFPETTPTNPDFYSIYHLGLKNKGALKNILFADASGEVFAQWAINPIQENVKNVTWIHQNANCFIFFVDCEALINGRSEAKENILDIANRLKDNLGSRPVAIVWSKADRINEVKPTIKSSLQEELNQIFSGQCKEWEVSNYTFKDPDLRCHQNNLEVLNWAIAQMLKPSSKYIELPIPSDSKDTFLNYRK